MTSTHITMNLTEEFKIMHESIELGRNGGYVFTMLAAHGLVIVDQAGRGGYNTYTYISNGGNRADVANSFDRWLGENRNALVSIANHLGLDEVYADETESNSNQYMDEMVLTLLEAGIKKVI